LIETVLRAMRNARDVMVLQIGADPWEVVHYRNADRLQMLRGPDAGNLQQMRRVHRPAAQDHLARRAAFAIMPTLAEGHADTALPFQQQTRRHRAGFDPQIGPTLCLRQKCLRRRTAEASVARHLRIPDALLRLPFRSGLNLKPARCAA
jgi:hypothetical protein